jgi:hypothetical protein
MGVGKSLQNGLLPSCNCMLAEKQAVKKKNKKKVKKPLDQIVTLC